MADDSTRITSSATADLLRQALLGTGATGSASGTSGAASASTTPRSSAVASNRAPVAAAMVQGRPGQRVLSPDFPMDQLDHSARRGTYIDLLV